MMQDRDVYAFRRKKKKIRLREIAKYIGCSIALLSRYENNELDMKEEKIKLYKFYIDNYK